MTTNSSKSQTPEESTLPIPSEKLGFLFWQINMQWVRKVNQMVSEHEMTHTQLITLVGTRWLSQNQEEVIQQDLVELVKIDRMLVSKMVKKNVEAGYLAKKSSENDSRVNVLELTEAGHNKIKQVLPVMLQAEQEFFGSLGDQRENLTKQLQSLLHHIEQAMNSSSINTSKQ
jgi:DNA-binding MarR family transcriptional regulator